MDEQLLKSEERAVFSLRALYKRYGYLPFQMSKFEEYDFYLQNKDFLVGKQILTFTDTDGTLLALKPDVTLSIIKNGKDEPGCKQKVCYNENVYRVSGSSGQYKEILQTGLECIGDIDGYDLYEVVSLAAQSLASISDRFVLEVSHLGVLSALLDEAGGTESFRAEATHCISEKNAHDLTRLCTEQGIANEAMQKLVQLIGLYGERDAVLNRLQPLCTGKVAQQALAELRELSGLLAGAPFGDRIRFDFSMINNMKYYNGVVLQGFLDGICEPVLAGGQYDKLMRRIGRKSGAVGFALYLDLLEELPAGKPDYDADVLLLYTDADDKAALAAKVRALVAQGKSVSVQKHAPARLRARECVQFSKTGGE